MGKIFRSHKRRYRISAKYRHKYDVLERVLRKRWRKQIVSEYLNFDDFKDCVKIAFEDAFPNTIVHVGDVYKNNAKLTGLSVMEEGEFIAPTIYIDDTYEYMKENGLSLSDTIAHMVENYRGILEKNDIPVKITMDNILNYDYVRDKILPRLVNIESNKEFLKDKPYIQKADLAEVFVVQHGCTNNMFATSYINNFQAEKLGLSASVLHNLAVRNMDALEPVNIESLYSKLMNMMMPEGMSMESDDVSNDIVIMSNKSNMYGAAAVLNDSYMDKLKEYMNTTDLYVIPSSVHEVLVFKADGLNVDDLEAMVREVNDKEVSDQDKLSDNVYKYDFDKHELFIAKDELNRKEDNVVTYNTHRIR